MPPALGVYFVTFGFLSGLGSFSFLAFWRFLFSSSFLVKFLALLAGVQTGFFPLVVSPLPQGSKPPSFLGFLTLTHFS